MRWAQTEGRCFWKENRWEEEKHRRLLISSLVLFLCYVCFMFPSSDWRDYRLCRYYVRVLLMWPNFIYFIGDGLLSFFLLLLGEQAMVYFRCPLTDLLCKWMPYVTPSFRISQRVILSNSVCSVLLSLSLLQSSFFLPLAISFEDQPWKIDWFALLLITTLQIAQGGILVV